MTKTLTQGDLRQFTGTEQWYRHGFMRDILYTEGAKYVADAGGAYWLLDKIVFAQYVRKIKAEPFQAWKLAVTGNSAVLTCEDGNGNKVFQMNIEYTDFPLPEITLWFTDNTILLPSEY